MLVVRQNLEDPFLLMTELSCYLGLRICEVLGLMWEDFAQRPELLRSNGRQSTV
jgi:integrase